MKNSEITGEAEEADRGSGEAEVEISSRQTASVGRIAAVNVNAIEELRHSLGPIIPWFAKPAVSKNIAYELLPCSQGERKYFSLGSHDASNELCLQALRRIVVRGREGDL